MIVPMMLPNSRINKIFEKVKINLKDYVCDSISYQNIHKRLINKKLNENKRLTK